MPLFSQQDVINGIRAISTGTTGGEYLEVFTSYLANPLQASEGIYVTRSYQADRIIHSNGILSGGHIYWIKDRIEMMLLTSQDNIYVDNLLAIFPAFLESDLFTGYFQREHTIEQVYANNSERYKVTFDLTRLQII
jgi:hypothetical protein